MTDAFASSSWCYMAQLADAKFMLAQLADALQERYAGRGFARRL